MAYISLADLAQLGQSQNPEQLEQAATALEAQAKTLRTQAAAMMSVNPGVANSLISNAQGMEAQAKSLRTQAAAQRKAAADAEANRRAAVEISSSLLNVGATVGSALIASEAARKAAADERKRAEAEAAAKAQAQGGLNAAAMMAMMQQGQGQGLSTGAMIGIGVAALAAVGIGVAVVISRKD